MMTDMSIDGLRGCGMDLEPACSVTVGEQPITFLHFLVDLQTAQNIGTGQVPIGYRPAKEARSGADGQRRLRPVGRIIV
jgi:hypothetical protein